MANRQGSGQSHEPSPSPPVLNSHRGSRAPASVPKLPPLYVDFHRRGWSIRRVLFLVEASNWTSWTSILRARFGRAQNRNGHGEAFIRLLPGSALFCGRQSPCCAPPSLRGMMPSFAGSFSTAMATAKWVCQRARWVDGQAKPARRPGFRTTSSSHGGVPINSCTARAV